jgi:hypothetical protein
MPLCPLRVLGPVCQVIEYFKQGSKSNRSDSFQYETGYIGIIHAVYIVAVCSSSNASQSFTSWAGTLACSDIAGVSIWYRRSSFSIPSLPRSLCRSLCFFTLARLLSDKAISTIQAYLVSAVSMWSQVGRFSLSSFCIPTRCSFQYFKSSM